MEERYRLLNKQPDLEFMIQAFMDYRVKRVGDVLTAVVEISNNSFKLQRPLRYKRGTNWVTFDPEELIGKRLFNRPTDVVLYWLQYSGNEKLREVWKVIKPWHFLHAPVGTWTKRDHKGVKKISYHYGRMFTRRYIKELSACEFFAILNLCKAHYEITLSDKTPMGDLSFSGKRMLDRVYEDSTGNALVDLFFGLDDTYEGDSQLRQRYPFLTRDVLELPARSRLKVGLEKAAKYDWKSHMAAHQHAPLDYQI